jgi:metal-responsive CopG/Arc/MetJ family transcriptional regulator
VKTAISLPDEVFEAADRMARRLGISRSELYVRAVRAYLDDLRRHDVTERLNAVYGEGGSRLDPVVGALQASALRRNR